MFQNTTGWLFLLQVKKFIRKSKTFAFTDRYVDLTLSTFTVSQKLQNILGNFSVQICYTESYTSGQI